jgi:phage FluMu gp28-like protein
MNSPLDILLPYQRRWVDDSARFKLGLWSRQTGKDFSSAAEIARDMQAKAKRPWMIAAPSERQSLESLAKVKEWIEAFNLAIEFEGIEREHEGALMKSAEILLGNGSRIIAVPGKPDTVRGFSANLLLTEFAFFDDPDATWKAVLPSITNSLRGGEKSVRIISTPNGKTGRGKRFYEIVRDNLLEPKTERKQQWSVHKITIHEAVKNGLPVDIDELREAMDDAEAFAQEFECEFLDGSSTLLPYDLIALAESHEASMSQSADFWQQRTRKLVCGVDFGRVNDPTVCWTLEEVGDVWVTREVLTLKGMSSPEQQEILSIRFKAAQKVCFDYTGPGIGLGDYLAKEHGKWEPDGHSFGKIELCTFTAGFKREIFPKLRRAFEAPVQIRIPVNVEVREDLHAMQAVVRNGEYSYSAPRTAEGHSDRCTALALAKRATSGMTGGAVSIDTDLGSDYDDESYQQGRFYAG